MDTLKEPEQHELHRQLELQRQYLDFLANTVEYLSQELSKVVVHLSQEPRSGCVWLETERVIPRPKRPAQLGAAQKVARVVPYNVGHYAHPLSRTHNSDG